MVDRTPLGAVQRRITDYIHLKWIRGEKAMGTHHGVTTLHNGQKIIVHTQDQYVCNRIRRYGVWEKEQVALLQHLIRPGFHIIEWGANYGAHTLFMAQKVGPTGHVWAFEPNPHVYPYLEQSIALNQLGDRITLHKTGVSNTAQSTSLAYSTENIGAGSIDSLKEHTVSITTVRTDDVIPPGTRCDILKMDIEGHEWKAIQGAYRLFQDNPNMIVIMEWSPYAMGPVQSQELVDFMVNQGYKAWRIQHWRYYKGKDVVLDPVSSQEMMSLVQKNDPHHTSARDQWDVLWAKDVSSVPFASTDH